MASGPRAVLLEPIPWREWLAAQLVRMYDVEVDSDEDTGYPLSPGVDAVLLTFPTGDRSLIVRESAHEAAKAAVLDYVGSVLDGSYTPESFEQDGVTTVVMRVPRG